MKIIVLIVAATIIVGCASTGGGSRAAAYMPNGAQLKAQNPYLLNCPANASPVCDVEGGRTRQVFTNCRCVRF